MAAVKPWFVCMLASIIAHAAHAQPTVPLVQPGPVLQPGVPIDATMAGTAEARAEHRDCMRKNAQALALLSASKEVVRTREIARNDRAQGRSGGYGEGELDRTWKYYKSLGGAAATPDAVSVPEDPCKASAEKFRQQADSAQARYRECAAAHPGEIRLARLSNEVVQTRQWLAAAEKVQEERLRNPNPDTRGSGEWAVLAKLEPAPLRAELAQKFSAYRGAGGPAARVEDVAALPNPCITPPPAPGPSPVRRQAIVIPERK